jgi:Mg2+ and Co2+ transporter CorA
MIEYIDKLLYYTITYQNLINDMIMIVSRIIIIINYNTENKENDDYDLFKNRIKVFRNNISELKEALEDTRHGTMQRIAYLDSGTARILTIVATIFLPTSFLVSLLSMPFDGVPFKNSKKGYLIILSIILSIFIMLIWFFYEEFINLFAKK